MPHFVEMKKKIKADILVALDLGKELDYKKTVAQFSLNTGFTPKSIKVIISQMEVLDYIEIEENIIKRPDIKK